MRKWSLNRKVEFTRMNTSTKSDIEDEGWHMVIAPHSAGKSSDQQDQLDGEFCSGLPRAHFLPPGCFHAAAERGAFSPDNHDLCFKGEWLQDQYPWDTSASVAQPYNPHPVSQPGFYSPQITRSRHCQPSAEFSMSKNTKEYSAHTLPLPHSKLAVFKQSALSSRPQGIKTSVVEKPQLMRAAISPTFPDKNLINPIQQQTYNQHVKDQEVQTQCFSSMHQCSLNLSSTEISKKNERLWTHCNQAQSTKKQSFFHMKQWAQEPHGFNNSFTLPQSPSSPDHHKLRRDSNLTGYCKLSVYNGTSYSSHRHQDISNCASSSQSHGRGIQNNSQLKSKQDSTDAGNYLVSNANKRQVDTKSKNVFGQPRVIATLRPGCASQPVDKTTVVEDLKKLILMDEGTDSLKQRSRSSSECHQESSSPKTLMFSSPICTRRPVPSPNQLFLQSDSNECQPRSGLSDTLVLGQDVQFDQDPLHLINTGCTLDWNRLVNAAEAYETQGVTDLLSGESCDIQTGRSSEPHSPHLPHALSEAPEDNVLINFRDPLSHLETMLMRLSTDLLKEKKDKVALLAEVLKLRMSNDHLKEESLTANAQLHKICQMFGINPETVE